MNAFLRDNEIYFPDGKRVTKELLPTKDYYIFYHTIYMMLDHGNDTTVLHHVRQAQELAEKSNVGFYLVTPSS